MIHSGELMQNIYAEWYQGFENHKIQLENMLHVHLCSLIQRTELYEISMPTSSISVAEYNLINI